MLHALIMAGGAGTRFWPESRRDKPKQLLNLTGQRSMIQHTLDRLSGLVPPQRTLILTNVALVEAMAQQLPELPRDRIIGEPCKRDTAPCIGLAALLMARKDPEAVMAVLPADHVIEPGETFRAALQQAANLAGAVGAEGRIVTFGIKPSYPAESFGYIRRGDAFRAAEGKEAGAESLAGLADRPQPPVYRVRQFKEKPSAEVAREYLASGEYYWNSGIFTWRAGTILDALRERQPQMMQHLERIAAAAGTSRFAEEFAREFAQIKGISIDFAVMEQARDVLVIEAPFTWDDVGNWRSLARLRGTDEQGNTIAARHLGLETNDCIIRGQEGHLLVTLGVRDLIIVQTADATLVADKAHEEAVREIVKRIEEQGWQECL